MTGTIGADGYCTRCQQPGEWCECPPAGAAPVGTTDNSGELSGTHDAYFGWFGEDYDIGALDVVLCAAAGNKLDGDPAWVQVVGGPGNCKTESVMPLEGAGAKVISTITGEAALLSATPQKDRAKNATGGLLRELGDSGIVVIKDFTSILSMNRDTRSQVLGALREIYDGHWYRGGGQDGGYHLGWHGRLVVISAVTTAWDRAYEVIATMGDRFVLVRLASDNNPLRRKAGLQAMKNVSHEKQMRQELKDSTGKLLAAATAAPAALDDDQLGELISMADVVTRARTSVERDYQGNPAWAHAPEMPTRFGKQLVQLIRGGLALGMNQAQAMDVATRAARDSIPPLRRIILADAAANPGTMTADCVKRVQLPRQTVDRTLQELHLLGLLEVGGIAWGETVRWTYQLASSADEEAVGKVTRIVSSAHGEGQ